MDIPTDLQTPGRSFLDALVARLGYDGAAGVLLLLAAEMKTAGRSRRPAVAAVRGCCKPN